MFIIPFFTIFPIFCYADSKPLLIEDNRLTLEINDISSDFYLSLNFNDKLSINITLINELKIDTKTKVIDEVRIGSLILNNIQFDISDENKIGLGLFINNTIKIDFISKLFYPEIKKEINEHAFTIDKSGLIKVKSKIINHSYNSDFLIDLSQKYNFIDTDFIKDNNFDKRLFLSAEIYNEESIMPQKIHYYEDFDLSLCNSKYYNKAFLFKDQNILGSDFFNNSVITLDLKNKGIEIINLNEDSEYLDNLLSENKINEVKDFLEANRDFKYNSFYKALCYKREGKTDSAKDLLFETIENDNTKIDKKHISLLLSCINEFQKSEDIKRIAGIVSKEKPFLYYIKDNIIFELIDKSNDFGKIDGTNGLIKYKLWKNKIFPQFRINDHQIKSIVFDTGWPFLTVDKYMAKKLGIRTLKKDAIEVTSSFRNGETVYWDYGLIDSITLGGIKLNNVICAVTSKTIFPGIQGVIGGGIINQFNYIIDNKTKTIVFQKRKFDKTTNGNMYLINDKPYIKVKIGTKGNEYLIHFDTGNDSSFGSNNMIIEEKISTDKMNHKNILSYDVLGFDLYDIFERKENIFINSHAIEKKDFYYRAQPCFHGPDIIKNYGNIGYELFSNYRLFINYDRMQFDFVKQSF